MRNNRSIIVVLVVLLISIGFNLYQNNEVGKIKDIININTNAHNLEIENLKKFHQEEIEKKEALILQYNQDLQEFSKKYELLQEQFEKKKKKNVKLIKSKSPKDLIDHIKDEFGFEYVK